MGATNGKVLLLRQGDDVAVAVKPLTAGEEIAVNGSRFTLKQDIPAGHKIAIHPIREDDPVRKYGQVIGFATTLTPRRNGHG